METNKVVKIFEDQPKRLNLTEEEKLDILELKNILKDNVVLEADGKLYIKHYVGFVQINRTRILIYPKITQGSNNLQDYDKAFNILIKMLYHSEFTSIKEIPTPQQLDKYSGDLLEVFIALFIKQLLKLFKRDVNRGYIRNQENQSFIKGKIIFSETIKKNSYQHHFHIVNYDEFSTNIILNRIFKTIIQHLIKVSQSKENKLNLRQALLWLEDVETIKLTNNTWKLVKFTRLNIHYKPVFNMAKLFYQNSQPNLNKGDELAFSFLIPVNQLFEMYLYKLISYNNQNYQIYFQGPKRHLGKIDYKNYLLLRPDITIMNSSNKPMMILDAKYKQIIYSEGNIKTNQSDIYQMIAYSLKYDCLSISLVYPKFLNYKSNDSIISTIEIPVNDTIIKINLIIVNLGNKFTNESEIITEMINNLVIG